MAENILESRVQRRIVLYLEDKGYYVVKIIQTTKNGWPDLQAYLQYPVMLHIEVKRLGEQADPLQLIRHEELRSRGFRVIVADSLESLIEQL